MHVQTHIHPRTHMHIHIPDRPSHLSRQVGHPVSHCSVHTERSGTTRVFNLVPKVGNICPNEKKREQEIFGKNARN